MTIAEQITRLKNAKAAIKQSIQNKGVTVSDEAKLDEYPALIDSIEAGGDGGPGKFYNIRTSNGINYKCLFYNYTGSTLDLSDLDASKVTTLESMFYGCSSLTSLKLPSLNTGSVTSLYQTFQGCSKLTSLDVSSLNTCNVTTAYYMFNGCTELTTLTGTSEWNLEKLTEATYMFYNCKKLIELDISSWNTIKLTKVDRMFYNCTALTTITGALDLSGLTNGFYPGSSTHPFYGCSALETVLLKNIYKNISITDNAKYSINLGTTKVKDECLVYIINELPNLADKGVTSNTKIVLTLPTTNTLTAEQVQVAIDKGWQVANTTY